jgi:hypothetical protein
MKTKLAIFALFVAITIVLGSFGVVGKPTQVQPEIEKVTFIHYAKSGSQSKPVWDDTADIYKLMFGGIKWTDTVEYKVNPANSGLEGYLAVQSALEASLATWNAPVGTTKLFKDSIEITEDNVNEDTYDDNHIVEWKDLGESGIIAMNSFWFNPATKEIIDSDIQFNTHYTWSVAEVCPSSAMDLQNIATHEFGHNGLNDLYNSPSMELTMYGYSDFGETDKRTLGTGDVLGIQALYGAS